MDDPKPSHKVTTGLPHEGEIHEYQPDPQSTVDYLRSIAPQKKRNSGKRILVALLVLVLLGGLGFGGYWLFLRDKPTNVQPKKQASSNSSNETTAATKHRTSTTFGLEFDYPEDWTINEVNGSNQLTARSPRMQLTDPGGKKVNGQIVLTIRAKGQQLAEFNDGSAIAARESEKIDYKQPSSVQRGSTYISFLRYSTTSNTKAMNGIYVTGDNGYQLDQWAPKTDFTSLDPIISITFATCANQDCTGSQSGTLIPVAASIWDNAKFSKPLKDMLASLVVN